MCYLKMVPLDWKMLWYPIYTNNKIPSDVIDGFFLYIYVTFQETEKASRETEKILKYRPYNRNIAHVEYKNQSDTSNNRDNWNYLKVIQKIPEQRTRKT
jgi:hypothetical protein